MATVAEILIDLPAAPDVAAGTVYGYTGSELTGSATDLASGSGVQRLKGRVPVWYMLGARAPAADATRLGVPTGVLGVLGNNDRLPALQVADGRFNSTAINLTAFVGETKTHTIVPRDTSGAPIDTGGVQLEYVIEKLNGEDVQSGSTTSDDEPLTQDADTLRIKIEPTTANASAGVLRYSVRVASTGGVIAYGRYSVAAVAEEGGPAADLERVKGCRIRVYTNEIITLELEADRTESLVGQSLDFSIWSRGHRNVQMFSSTGTENGFRVTIPKLEKQNMHMEWACRIRGSGEVVKCGLFQVHSNPT